MTALVACGEDSPSILDPKSSDAGRVAGLWWVMFWISVVVVAIVSGFLLWAVRRRLHHIDDNSDNSDSGDATDRPRIVEPANEAVDHRPVPWGDRFVVIAGMVVPGVILVSTFGLSLGVLDGIADPPGGEDEDLRIEVVSRNWWWEVRYPDGVETANEIHIPVGEPVELALPTADVIHSFWVPELQVKEDHIPGAENRLVVEADRAGRFRGQCAEFCGYQHAHMAFQVIAEPRRDFDRWVAAEAQPARAPAGRTQEEGLEILESASCAGCHTIRGTSAQGDLGPDLTHVARRQTIGAGLSRLTPANLADFIADPHDDKPGVSMPPSELTDDEIDAVVTYLMEAGVPRR